MSITIISQSATAEGLEPKGAVPRPLGTPVCETRSVDIPLEGAGTNRTGLWEVSPGRFERHLASAEVMHILTGSCTFTPTGGEPREIRAGDTLFFPANTFGVWDIRETLRKTYVVMG